MRLWTRILFASLMVQLALGAPPLAAAESDPAATTAAPPVAPPAVVVVATVDLPPMVVTGRRQEQKLLEADRSLHRVDRERLTVQQPQGMAEAVQEAAGVHVQQTNRGAGSLYLRGLVGPQNLLLVDGIRFSNSTFRTGPNQYLSLLDPVQTERVEVLLGPGSVLYGSDAVGGVLQVLPSEWRRDGLQTRGGVRHGSADASWAAWGEDGWRGEHGGILAGGAWREFGALRVGGGDLAPASDYQQGAWHLRGRWQPTPEVTLDATWLGARLLNAGRTDQLTQGRLRFYDNASDLGWLDARWKPAKGGLRELRLALSLHRTEEVVEQYHCTLGTTNAAKLDAGAHCVEAAKVVRQTDSDPIPADPTQRHDRGEDTVWTPGALATASLRLLGGKVQVLTGAEAYRDQVMSTRQERRGDKDPKWSWLVAPRGGFSDDSTWRALGGFIHAEADLWRDGRRSLSASAGGRVSQVAAQAAAVPGVGDVAYDFLGGVGSVGLRYLHDDVAMVYVNASQGFRAPNLQETTVLGNTGSKFEVPNAGLQPERSNALELGARVAARRLTLHAAGYVNRLEGLIDERKLAKESWAPFGIDAADVGCKSLDDPKCVPIPVIQRVNAEGGRFVGTEASLRVGPWLGISAWLDATWLRGDVSGGPAGDVPARRVPPPLGTAGLRYDQGGLYVEAFGRGAAAQDRLHPSDEDDLRLCEDPAVLGTTYKATKQACPGTPAWKTLNLRGGYRFGSGDAMAGLRLDVAATNLLDARYRTHGSGVAAAGLGVTVSLGGAL
ncbi:MAG: TonB-dependent receptor [Myxococcales bacterium]|nr:TonB-dependent receptor [Myxococcales bacterium]